MGVLGKTTYDREKSFDIVGEETMSIYINIPVLPKTQIQNIGEKSSINYRTTYIRTCIDLYYTELPDYPYPDVLVSLLVFVWLPLPGV